MALKKRVEVLFEPEKFSYLERKAKREKTSVGKLIREAVETVYLEKEGAERKAAIDRILAMEIDLGIDWAETSWEEIEEQMAEDRTRDILKCMGDSEVPS